MTEISRRRVLGLAGGVALVAAVTPARIASGAAPTAPSPGADGTVHPSGSFVPVPDPVSVDLSDLYNNDAVDTASSHDGNFDAPGTPIPASNCRPGAR